MNTLLDLYELGHENENTGFLRKIKTRKAMEEKEEQQRFRHNAVVLAEVLFCIIAPIICSTIEPSCITMEVLGIPTAAFLMAGNWIRKKKGEN